MALSLYIYLHKANYITNMIGRQSEIELLEKAYKSEKSEFVALYGRRRVGKTFLIRSVFKNRMTFQLSGLANANMAQQLMNFNLAIEELGTRKENKTPKNWMEALQLLKRIISNLSSIVIKT